MRRERVPERLLVVTLAAYLFLTLAASGYLAWTPATAPLRGWLRPGECAMRVQWGLPCPLCFGTTTYMLIWRGYFAQALVLSPFVFGMFWGSTALVPLLTWAAVSRRPLEWWFRRLSIKGWLLAAVVVFALLLANWAYLIATRSGVASEALLKFGDSYLISAITQEQTTLSCRK